ncbi:MAG: helix-turn-helix domain-containing protein [bacterium]
MAESAHSVKTPCQSRSRDSLERILKTAENLIRTKGFEALTVAEVVRRSRTSTGTLYARFADKTALLHAVQERVHGREEAQMRDRVSKVDWSALSLEDTVQELVDIKRAVTKGNERLLEAFVVHGATDPTVRRRGYRYKATVENLEVEVLMRHAAQIGHSDPESAARVASRLWQAAQEEHVQRSRSGVSFPGAVPQDLLIQKLAEVAIAYLRSPDICERSPRDCVPG